MLQKFREPGTCVQSMSLGLGGCVRNNVDAIREFRLGDNTQVTIPDLGLL